VINPRAVALQGIGFSPRLRLVQGFGAVEDTTTQIAAGGGGGGKSREHSNWAQQNRDDAFDIALYIILSGALE
jgi:hypothetical protein